LSDGSLFAGQSIEMIEFDIPSQGTSGMDDKIMPCVRQMPVPLGTGVNRERRRKTYHINSADQGAKGRIDQAKSHSA
jgi:hypothetical protein